MDRLKEIFYKIAENKVFWIIAAIIIGISSTIFLGKDNIVEQLSEDVIYQETGERIDLTPEVEK